jgi:copper oxidase (laccase) domain-containing protein
MVTSLHNIELHVRVADCGNIYAYDPIWWVIGVCHSGRKGTHKNIIKNMIENIKILWSLPEDIFIRTGPCISWKNYQFWSEVKDLFEDKYYELRWQYYYLDLLNLHRDQLLWAWIVVEHIIQSDICTFDSLILPSYRRDGADSGRITWSIMMKN